VLLWRKNSLKRKFCLWYLSGGGRLKCLHDSGMSKSPLKQAVSGLDW